MIPGFDQNLPDDILTRLSQLEEQLQAIRLAVGTAPVVCLSPTDAARSLGVDVATIEGLIDARQLGYVPLGDPPSSGGGPPDPQLTVLQCLLTSSTSPSKLDGLPGRRRTVVVPVAELHDLIRRRRVPPEPRVE
jgi:hypothetical protein